MHVEDAGRWSGEAVEDAARALRGAGGLAWLDGDGSAGAGRRSYLACAPVEVVRAEHGDADPLGAAGRLEGCGDDSDAPRWVGYVAYDAWWAGRASRHARGSHGGPVLWWGRYDAVLEVDHARGVGRIVADDAAAAARLRERLGGAGQREAAHVGALEVTPADAHARAVEAAREHIAAGDIYQVNLARRWRGSFEGSALTLWEAMRRASPVPYGLYVDAGDHQVLARTMERFLDWTPDVRGVGRIETRPIKGTKARRGDDGAEAAALRADTKERAEHAMIVDLMRNDLGRVAEIGSVEVVAPLTVEPYAKLHHLVTTVRARTRPGTDLGAVLRATFPPGSVTGAPKRRALEIIDALEPHPRGVYCGCVGHVDRRGGAHLAVAIRTAVVRGGAVEYFAGGGLVWASEAAREVAETELKARVFLDAIEDMHDSFPG